MGDFFQNGTITTLHDLCGRSTEALEKELVDFSALRPMGLVLPSLYSELQTEALPKIVAQLCQVPYLEEIVIGLDNASREEFEHAKRFFSVLPQRHRILWHDGPAMQQLDQLLASEGLAPRERGKGRNVWYCYGYLLASGRSDAVALHDCDIITYDRRMLARLLYPVVHPSFNYHFCKGYYYRVSGEDRFGGRVSRLLVSPLIRALTMIYGPMSYLNYLDSFRYPLAGEFAMRADVMRAIRIPSDWGLEIGVLWEVKRNYTDASICQIDIAERYDHKHNILSKDDSTQGLNRMSTEIARVIFRKLATQGVVFSPEQFRTIKATYFRTALDLLDQYNSDAVVNGLQLDRHQEEKTIEVFSQCIMAAGEQFLNKPMDVPFIPSWNRVLTAIPDFYQRISAAVEEDNS